MKEAITFIGLGTMGYPMAGHLQRAGYPLTVFNRTAETSQRWVQEYQGTAATTVAEAVAGASVVFTCLGADPDVRAVLSGDGGVFAGVSPGTVIVDHSTSSAALARELAQTALERGCQLIDAPVSGGQRGAQEGVLTVMAGGDEASYQRVEPIIGSYARRSRLLGPSGSGQLAKMVNQICIAGLVQGLAEGIHFARSAGLDVAAVMEVISAGAAQSWQMENRYQTMIAGEYDFGFAVDWMRKDLAYALAEARSNGSHLPVAALVDQLYGEVQALGGGRWDTSSLLARLERMRTE